MGCTTLGWIRRLIRAKTPAQKIQAERWCDQRFRAADRLVRMKHAAVEREIRDITLVFRRAGYSVDWLR